MAVASMASGIADFAGQSSAQAKQKQSYDEWFAQQEKNRVEQGKQQEHARQLADQARAQTVNDVSGPVAAQAQGAEADRLAAELRSSSPLTADAPAAGDPGAAGVTTSAADPYLLSPSQGENSDAFKSDLASKIHTASLAAKERIKNMAAVGSYTNSSQGLDRYFSKMFQRSGQGIDLQNEKRRGDLAVYGIQQAVQPVAWSYTPGLRIG
jgi:hypothetical protein